MNQVYLPFIALAIFIPLFISPISIQGFGVEDGNINVLIDFETPKNENAIKNNVETQLFGKFNAIGNDFKNKAQYSSYQSLNFTFAPQVDEMVFPLGDGVVTDHKRYQLSPELQYIGSSNITHADFDIEYDLQVSQLRLDMIEFIQNNNGVTVTSYLKFSFGEVIIDELI